MKCRPPLLLKMRGQRLFACGLVLAGLGLVSCGDGEGTSHKDSGASGGSGLDGSGKDALRVDASVGAETAVVAEAGALDLASPDERIADVAVRLDVQLLPDAPAIEAANRDVYEAPSSPDVAVDLTSPFSQPDVPLVVEVDAPVADVPVDLAVEQPRLDVTVDVLSQPDAQVDAPSGTGGSGGCAGGGCVQCLRASDCAQPASACKVSTCINYACGVANASAGSACNDNGGDRCDGNGNCVNHCSDGVKDDNETDVDCGGACATKCQPYRRCLAADDCTTQVCNDTPPPSGTGGTGGSGSSSGSGTGGNTGSGSTPTHHRPHLPPATGGVGGGSSGQGTGGVGGSGGTGGGGSSPVELWCQEATCLDGVKNGHETDVDCGGPCDDVQVWEPQRESYRYLKCEVSRTCATPNDCLSGLCGSAVGDAGGIDGGIDGGTGPQVCLACSSNNDCPQTRKDCFHGEGDTVIGDTTCDMGRGYCVPCGGTNLCANLNYCANGQGCIAQNQNDARCVDHCLDGRKDYDEVGTDCGGGCGLCPNGETCSQSSDCLSNHCVGGDFPICVDHCQDRVLDADEGETDVDCGGTCQKCEFDKACLLPVDCTTNVCRGSADGQLGFCGCNVDNDCIGGEGYVCDANHCVLAGH
jgi:hypothetical protein